MALRNKNREFMKWWTLRYGVIARDGKAQCIICSDSVVCRTYSVKRHFERLHKELTSNTEDELKEFFTTKLEMLNNDVSPSVEKSPKPNNSIVAASYEFANHIAKHGKSLSDGELTKETMLACCDYLFEDFENCSLITERLRQLPCSRNTIRDRIRNLASDISSQLRDDLQKCDSFSLCLDEISTAISKAKLAVIVRYPTDEEIKEELLRLLPLPNGAQGRDICQAILQLMSEFNIDKSKIISVTTNGAHNMTDAETGFIGLFSKEIGHKIISFNCILPQEALWAQDSQKEIEKIMAVVAKITNYILIHGHNHEQFKSLLAEVDPPQFTALVMHNSIRWVSHGRVLHHFAQCLTEIKLFMELNNQHYPQMYDHIWLTDMMFYADFNLYLNEFNTKLQCRGKTAKNLLGAVNAFEKKIKILKTDLDSSELKYFPLLKHCLQSEECLYGNVEKTLAIEKFSIAINFLIAEFQRRFGLFRKLDETLEFITNPDTIEYAALDLIDISWLDMDNLEMQMAEFQENFIWKTKFINLRQQLEILEHLDAACGINAENEILYAWTSLPNCFDTMKKLALSLLSFFGSTDSCKQLSAAVKHIKSDARNRLADDLSAASFTLKTSTYKPRIKELAENSQQQISH